MSLRAAMFGAAISGTRMTGTFARRPFLAALTFAMAAVVGAPARAETACGEPGASSLFYGPSGPCGRVLDRLRVDPRARRDMSAWGVPRGFAPFPDEGAMPAHQRLDGAYGHNAPRLR